MSTIRSFAAMLLLVLSGCSMTVFESLPPGEVTRCDPNWPGHWAQIKSPGDKPAGETTPEVVEIDANCSKSGKPGDTAPAPLVLITTPDGRQYLDFLNDDGRPQCQPGKEGPGKKCGHLLLRYEYIGNEIRVYDVDHAKLASLIGKKKIRGETERMPLPKGNDAQPPIHFNLVTGDANHIGKVLKDNPGLFQREPITVMRRATPEQIAEAKAKQAAEEAAKAAAKAAAEAAEQAAKND